MPAKKNLSPLVVAEIRRRKREEDITNAALAQLYGIDKALVSRIVNGKAYTAGPFAASYTPPPHPEEPAEASAKAGVARDAPAPAEIPIADIGAGNNPRTGGDDFFDLDELVASIKAHGVIEPVIVRPPTHPADSGGRPYQLVAGERRWRAAHIAGLKTIPAIVRTLNDGDALEVALIENLQRRDMHPLDEARAFKRLKRLGRTTAQIAANVGRTERHVQKRIQVAERLPERAKAMLRGGRLSLAQAEAIAEFAADQDGFSTDWPHHVDSALDLVEAGKLRTEADLRAYLSPRAASPAPPAPSAEAPAGAKADHSAPGGTSPAAGGAFPQPNAHGVYDKAAVPPGERPAYSGKGAAAAIYPVQVGTAEWYVGWELDMRLGSMGGGFVPITERNGLFDSRDEAVASAAQRMALDCVHILHAQDSVTTDAQRREAAKILAWLETLGADMHPLNEAETAADDSDTEPPAPHPEEAAPEPPGEGGSVARDARAAAPRFTIVWETVGIGGDVRRPDVPAAEVPDRIQAEAPHGWDRVFRVTVERQPDPVPTPEPATQACTEGLSDTARADTPPAAEDEALVIPEFLRRTP